MKNEWCVKAQSFITSNTSFRIFVNSVIGYNYKVTVSIGIFYFKVKHKACILEPQLMTTWFSPNSSPQVFSLKAKYAFSVAIVTPDTLWS